MFKSFRRKEKPHTSFNMNPEFINDENSSIASDISEEPPMLTLSSQGFMTQAPVSKGSLGPRGERPNPSEKHSFHHPVNSSGSIDSPYGKPQTMTSNATPKPQKYVLKETSGTTYYQEPQQYTAKQQKKPQSQQRPGRNVKRNNVPQNQTEPVRGRSTSPMTRPSNGGMMMMAKQSPAKKVVSSAYATPDQSPARLPVATASAVDMQDSESETSSVNSVSVAQIQHPTANVRQEEEARQMKAMLEKVRLQQMQEQAIQQDKLRSMSSSPALGREAAPPVPAKSPLPGKQVEALQAPTAPTAAPERSTSDAVPMTKAQKRRSALHQVIHVRNGSYSIVTQLKASPSMSALNDPAIKDKNQYVGSIMDRRLNDTSSSASKDGRSSSVDKSEMSLNMNPTNFIPPIAPYTSILEDTFENELLQPAIELNGLTNVRLASVTAAGHPVMSNIEYYSLMETDPRIVLFMGSTLNTDLAAVVKNSQTLHTLMSTHEIPVATKNGGYKIVERTISMTGKIYTVVSPRYACRFGSAPKVINIPKNDGSETTYANDSYWEEVRHTAWESLTDEERAVYTWPATGERAPAVESIAKMGYECDSLPLGEPENDVTQRSLYHTAVDSFAVLVFKISDLDVKEKVIVEDALALQEPNFILRDINYVYGWRDMFVAKDPKKESMLRPIPSRKLYTLIPPTDYIERDIQPVAGSWYQVPLNP